MHLVFAISRYEMTKSISDREKEREREILSSHIQKLHNRILCARFGSSFPDRVVSSNHRCSLSQEQGNQSETFGLLRVMVKWNYRIPIAGLLLRLDKDRCAPAIQWVSNCVIPLLHNNSCGSAGYHRWYALIVKIIDWWMTFLLAEAILDGKKLRFNVTYFDWIRRHNRAMQIIHEWQCYKPSRFSHKHFSIIEYIY